MEMGHELGQVKEGYIADLLLVPGDPLKDLAMMVDEKNLHVIMKDGAIYKNETQAAAQERAA